MYLGQKPLYFSQDKHRVSPAWILNDFIRNYKDAMCEAKIELNNIWGVLISNSYFINYEDMGGIWDEMGITVYHNFKKAPMPYVYYSTSYHESLALPQVKAFKLWCDVIGDVKYDPFAFDDIDADYDEMEYGLNDKDIPETFRCDDEDDEEVEGDGFLFAGSHRKRPLCAEILPPIPHPQEELEKMIGCQRIKSQINDLIQLTRYNKKMHHFYPDWKQHQVSLHAIFFGRPGTGKTTVCKIYGGLLKEAGVLSKGHVVVCNRGTFVGPNWGDEETAIQQAMKKAKGGVLMIDEAYLLNSNHPNDPGKLILPLLMDILSNEQQRDIAIVLCGYKEQMLRLLELNPGLTSRFPNHFEFEDFSINELMKITSSRMAEYGYHFTRSGLLKYKAVLTEAYRVRNPNNWGNARFVANLLENIYITHAKRCMKSKKNKDMKSFFAITPADIQPIEVPREKRRIGF